MLEFLILYIDADVAKSKSLTSQLELPSDVHFIFTDSGMEGLSIASDHKVSLIVLSETLSHKMSGKEVCQLLTSTPLTAAIPIIFLSDSRTSTPCSETVKFLNTSPSVLELQKKIIKRYKDSQGEKDLQREKNLVLSIVNKIHSPIFIISYENVSFANQYFLDFFSLKSIEDFSLHYSSIQDLFIHDIEEELSLLQWIKELLHENKEHKAIMQNRENEQMVVKVRGELLEKSNEYLIITQDITAEETHEKKLLDLYNTDHLTKLPNRFKLIVDLQKYDELALAILDIDSFKIINDFYGHVIGDFLIYEVAKRIGKYISHESLCFYRLPSDSFAIVNKKHIEKEYFELIIISLIQIVSKSPFIYIRDDGEEVEIYANITAGIVFEKESALAHADIALREAKNTHKDYSIYHNDMRQEIAFSKNMEWIKKIKTAIIHDKIVPYFQPIIENSTQKTVKFECLVRLIDEEGDVISPFFFLDIAKQSKQYESISKVMIKKSFQAFTNTSYEFSINLSIEDIIEYNLFEYIKSMLAIYPLADQVCFEILETEEIENYQVIADFVTGVRELGCKVSIDDFGSGYSNFSHLLNLNFDYLKIDASLIKDIHEDKNKQIIVKTIVTFAKELGIKTIGEFVESKAIYDHITEMGIDYSQGYYFSPPVATIS
ncbi:EAL domain-containing protein [Campylobacterota bacterium]